MAVKMIALDLDGTTLRSDKSLSLRTVKALSDAIDRDINVVIATGRCLGALPAVMRDFPGIQYAITSNGAQLIDLRRKETVSAHYHLPANVERMAELLRPLDPRSDMVEIFIDGEAYLEDELYRATERGEIGFRSREYVLTTRTPVKGCIDFMLEHKDKVENVNIFFPSAEERERVKKPFAEMEGVTYTTSWDWNLEVGPANTSKANTLMELCGRLGVKKEEIMACGDSPNDIDMMKLAAYPIAVGNAKDPVKKEAVFVSDTNDNDGVAIAIEKYALV
jgi:Cof subfamily protein (haloacid dehalogenase superfamily)